MCTMHQIMSTSGLLLNEVGAGCAKQLCTLLARWSLASRLGCFIVTALLQVTNNFLFPFLFFLSSLINSRNVYDFCWNIWVSYMKHEHTLGEYVPIAVSRECLENVQVRKQKHRPNPNVDGVVSQHIVLLPHSSLRLLSVQCFPCSAYVYVGFLWGHHFHPTSQNILSGESVTLGVKKCVHVAL